VLVERPTCPVCGSPPGRTIYACAFADPPIRDYLIRFYPSFTEVDLALLTPGELVLEECSRCFAVWQRFAPTGDLLSRLYEDWAADGGALERHDDAAYHRAAAEEILLVQALAGKRPSEIAVLDFGMGWGRWPRLAAAFGMDAYGIELSRHQSEYASSQGVKVLTLEELPPARFDFVNTEQVFEHLVDPRGTLQALARSLAPGGWLKIAVPDASGIAQRLERPDWSSRALNPVAPLEHLNAFGGRALEELGRQAGLRLARPPLAAYYASTIGLWPPRRVARGVGRPLARRVSPGAAFFRSAASE
jgi:SAM-dependent methyltransferase